MPKHAKVDSASSLHLALRNLNFSIFGEFFRDLELAVGDLVACFYPAVLKVRERPMPAAATAALV